MSSPKLFHERQPLLVAPDTSPNLRVTAQAPLSLHSDSYDELGYEVQAVGAKNRLRDLKALVSSILRDSIPIILSYTLQNSIQTISILIAGRLGPDELSAAAISLMIAFVTGWCVALGGTTALDTLGSQSYTGGNTADLSVHFQRCVILLYVLFIPVGVFWAYVEPVLLALGQPVGISKEIQRFLRLLLFGAPGYIGFESLKKYLQCQGIMTASTVVLLIVSPVNVALNIFLVHYTPLGLLGSPIALSITYWLCFIVLCLFAAFSSKHSQNGTWGGVHPKDILNLGSCYSFLLLAIPGVMMVGTEWAAFEIVALAAGRLGELPLAAQSIIMTTDQILNTIPFGIGVAATTRVGNLIGSQSITEAKQTAHASAVLSVILGTVVMLALVVLKDVYGFLFSDDVQVVELVSAVMPLVASFQIADGLANSCGGVLRSQGRQKLGATLNFIAYYVIALPMGIGLAFNRGFGLRGLWIGQVVGLFVVGIGELVLVARTDWGAEVKRGIERNAKEAERRGLRATFDHM